MKAPVFAFFLLLLSGCLAEPGSPNLPSEGTGPWIDPRHGSAILHQPDPANRAEVYLRGELLQELAIEGNETLVPFLEPSTTYEIRLFQSEPVRGHVIRTGILVTTLNFTTPEAVRLYSPTAQVRPGIKFSAPDLSTCTLGFLARDAANETLYGITAGHCFTQLNETAWLEGTYLGQVVARRIDATTDWALVQLSPDVTINPEVIHIGGPTGLQSTAPPGSVACLVGQSVLALLSPDRCGVVIRQAGENMFSLAAAVYAGDSGGPIVNEETGQAMGIVEGFGAGITAIEVDGILNDAKQSGFDSRILVSPEAFEPVLPRTQGTT